MKQKRGKYDTNPLDPDYVKNTEELWGSNNGSSHPETQEVKGTTRKVGPAEAEDPRQNVYSEAPTRRYDNVSPETPYPSIFIPPAPSKPAPYQPPGTPYQPNIQRPTSRTISGIGIPEKWGMILPYAPFYIGVIVSLLELFLVPRKEPRVRFHAAQGLALYIAITVVQTMFGIVAVIADNSIGSSLFSFATTIFLIVSMARVWKGKPHYIAPIAEPARWFNEHIEPRNKS